MPFKIRQKSYGLKITSTGEIESSIKLTENEVDELYDFLRDVVGERRDDKGLKQIEAWLSKLATEMSKQSLNQANGIYQVLQELRIQKVAGAQDVEPFNFAQLETKIDFLIRTLNGNAAPREEGKDPFQSE